MKAWWRKRKERIEGRDPYQESRLRLFRSRYILMVLVPLAFLTGTALRFDHLYMSRLRDAVLRADQEGNEQAMLDNLKKLQDFTRKNIVINVKEMNGETRLFFGTGPFYLEQQYVRKASTEIKKLEEKVSKGEVAGGKNIYNDASKVCQPIAKRQGWAWNSKGYIDCMMGELAKHQESPEINDVIKATLPSTLLYRHDYVSPVWAPTVAGWMMLGCGILVILLVVRVLWWLLLKITLATMRKNV